MYSVPWCELVQRKVGLDPSFFLELKQWIETESCRYVLFLLFFTRALLLSLFVICYFI